MQVQECDRQRDQNEERRKGLSVQIN
jgi:hypothetical protein